MNELLFDHSFMKSREIYVADLLLQHLRDACAGRRGDEQHYCIFL